MAELLAPPTDKSAAVGSCSPEVRSLLASKADKKRPGWWKIWAKQVCALVVALAFIVGLACFLRQFDDQPLPAFSLPPIGQQPSRQVSFNTILDIFKSAISIALAIPLGKCLGQLTWVWFSAKKRPLSDYSLFESATQSDILSLVRLAARTNFR